MVVADLFVMPQIQSGSLELELVSVADLLSGPPQEREYLLEDVLPIGVVGLLVAPGGIGKSMFLLDMAVSVASGLPVVKDLFGVAAAGHVVIAAAEDDLEEVHRRLAAVEKFRFDCNGKLSDSAFEMRKRISILPCTGRQVCLMEEGVESVFFENLVTAISVLSDVRLLIIDPLRRFLYGDENDSFSAVQTVILLERLAKNTGATVLAAHHVSKAAMNGKLLDAQAARGSSAFTDSVRFQMNLARLGKQSAESFGIPQSHRHLYLELAVTKNNYAPPQSGRIVLKLGFDGVLEHVPVDDPETDTSEIVITKILKAISTAYQDDKPFTKSVFISENKGKHGAFGVSEKELRQLLDSAIEDELIVTQMQHKSGKGKPSTLLLPPDSK